MTTVQSSPLLLGSRADIFDQLLSTPFLDRYLPRQCMRRLDQGEVVNLETGVITPHQCGALLCRYCVKVRRRQLVRAVGASEPQAMLTLTHAPEEVSTTSTWMKNVRRNLERKGYPLEWCWTVECNQRRRNGSHDHHVHALAHGEIPPPHVLIDVGLRAGFGLDSDVGPIDDPHRKAGYLWTKRYKWYPLDVPHRLWVNGERVHHATHGFWRVDGEPVRGGYRGVLKRLNSVSPEVGTSSGNF